LKSPAQMARLLLELFPVALPVVTLPLTKTSPMAMMGSGSRKPARIIETVEFGSGRLINAELITAQRHRVTPVAFVSQATPNNERTG
jgi:hypothetical protein